MRASMVTRPALDRLRPGSIDWESSRVNFRGQTPTLPRNTATGMPGESTDLATMNTVAPGAAFASSAGVSVTSPLTAAPDPADAAVGVSASDGTGGSRRARARAASAGRPKNSNDFANSSQSSALPLPLARRDSRLVMALAIDP